ETMIDKNIDLLALSESRWQGHGITQIQSCTILHSGSDSSHTSGVAIALSPHARSSWEAAGRVFTPVNDRIMHIRLKSHLSYTTVIAVYAPTNPVSSTSESNQPSEDLYNDLHSVLATIPPTDMVVILGDFNARVGTDTNTWHTVLGPHGMGQVIENGQRLLDFCATNKLLITNTWYQHKSKHQCTWFRNGDRSNPGHMIDYILVSAKYRNSILDTRVYHGVHHQSDHELVISTLRFKIKAKRRQCHHPPPRQTKCLPKDIVSAFRTSLAVACESHHTTPNSPSPSPSDVADKWTAFKAVFQDACGQLPSLPRKKEVDWITDEVKN
ncbi:MAG: endonuclease/exonuclease/phosphatase family protein, partial [Alphaproteobacteria bacterium]|nr:endonuclease/exonuclease/phosphatase family protein [Alphaproteobacteria bacterium]